MDIKNWRRSSSTRTINLGKHHEALDQSAVKSPKIKWKMIWRKFLKQKNVFGASGRVHVQSLYDTETYMQNFDQGQTLEETDAVFRSFSMRFADSSKLFPQKDLILF